MNLFASLVDRALGRAPVLQRRRPAVFEPVRNAVLSTRENTFDSLREEQSYTEAESPAPRKVNTASNIEPEDSTATSQHSNVTSMVTPKATDITIVEEQPSFNPSTPQPNERDDSAGDLPIREQNLTQESQQLSKLPSTPALAPSLETIVEAKSETQVQLQNPGDDKPFDEVDLVSDAAQHEQASIVNNIVVLRSIAQQQNSEQFDESHRMKPVQQRRPTRQQMQRSAQARSQPAHEQLDTPATPTINVTIGRVEVRASAPAKRAAESTRQAGPKLSLDEYLRGRSKGN